MSKRKCVVCIASFVMVALAIGLLYLVRDRCPIRYRNFDRIQPGMTLAEVDELLGCSPGDHSTGATHLKTTRPDGSTGYEPASFAELKSLDERKIKIWFGDAGVIMTLLDAEGQVVEKEFIPGRRIPPDWWLAIERMAGLDP